MVEAIIFAALGVALSVILSVIGAALGISISAPAIAGAGTERPEIVSKSLIATILAEALAIYGLVVGLLSLFAIPSDTTTVAFQTKAFRIFSGGLTMGVAALGAGLGIGTSGGAMASATAEKPELFSRTVVPLILSEALAIYALVVSLLLILGA